jgi:CDP-diacylglycerol--glycerol-3-phosphate 3-phosphatidyltransferase
MALKSVLFLKENKNMNLPNKLSVVRITIVPIIVLVVIFPYEMLNISIPVFTFDYVSISLVNIIVLVLFAFGSFTDFLDGYLARRDNLITTFGKFIDPIADKMLTTTMFIIFAAQGIIPMVAVIIMVWRDIIVDGIRMVASNEGKVMAAGYLGKIKTVAQIFTIMIILLNNLPFELIGFPMADFLLWFSVSISFISGLSYFLQAKDFLFKTK